MEQDNRLELDAETMRRMGYRAVDMIVDRITGLDAAPAWGGGDRATLQALVGTTPPEEPADFDALLDHLAETVLPYAGRIDHPRFFAFVPSCPTWPGILGDFIATGHTLFQGTWLESSGPSTLELLVLDWFRSWIDYPPTSAGLLTSGGSAANLDALVCARDAVLGHETGRGVIYTSEQAHSSMERAARILGFRPEQYRTLPVDGRFRLRLDALRAAVDEDLRAGRRPFLIAANGGATSTGAVDPLPELADFAARHHMWLHVDAAYGGFAILTERGREALRGLEGADSITLDPHKWLYQPYEAGCLMVRHGQHLHDAFHVMPDYLQDTAVAGEPAEPDAREVNFADRGLQLTRAARAIKIWLSLRTFGLDAFRDAIDRSLDLAEEAQDRIERSDTLELLTPAMLGTVCFRRTRPGATEDQLEDLNAALVQTLSDSGLGMISSTRIHGRYALKLCILNHRSRREDVDRVVGFLESSGT